MELQQQQTSGADQSTLMVLGTSITSKAQARDVMDVLYKVKDIQGVSIDLEDWEHVLRITSHIPISFETISELLQKLEVRCYELPE